MLRYGFEIDIWSLGVVSYILLCGYAPFEGQNDEETFEFIKNKELKFMEEDWLNISELAIDLIRKMLDRNPQSRIKADEILNHSWFKRDQNLQENEKLEVSKSSEVINTDMKTEISAERSEETKKDQTKSNSSKLVLSQIKKKNNYNATNIQVKIFYFKKILKF